jgi:hypothetical protein
MYVQHAAHTMYALHDVIVLYVIVYIWVYYVISCTHMLCWRNAPTGLQGGS